MLKKIVFSGVLVSISGYAKAVDLANLFCNQPQMSESVLTGECKSNTLIEAILCRGNEGKVWCKSANLEVGEVSNLSINFGFRNRHVIGHIHNIFTGNDDPIVPYDDSSTGNITVWVDKNCHILDKRVTFSNVGAQVLQWLGTVFGKRIEDSIPNEIPGCK